MIVKPQNKRYQLIDKKKKLRAKQNIDLKIHLDGSMSLSANGNIFPYKAIEQPKKLNKQLQKKGYSEQLKRIAGYKGKQASPWNQFNPNWFKLANKRYQNNVANNAIRI